MGDYVEGLIVREKAPFENLDQLHESIACKVYRQPGFDAYLIETFGTGDPNEWPFTAGCSIPDGESALSEELIVFDQLYRAQVKLRMEYIQRSFFYAPVQISKVLDTEIMYIATDADYGEMICIAKSGKLFQMRYIIGEIELTYNSDGIFVQPLSDPEEEYTKKQKQEILGTLNALKERVPEITIIPGWKPMSTQLHDIAMEESKKFLGIDNAPLGLGCFDGVFDIELELVMESRPGAVAPEPEPAPVPAPKPKPVPTPAPRPQPVRKAWWQFWK